MMSRILVVVALLLAFGPLIDGRPVARIVAVVVLLVVAFVASFCEELRDQLKHG